MANEHLRRLTIRSPVQGVVFTERLDRLRGAFVHPGDQLLEVGNPEIWHATISVMESDMHDVHVGDSATIEVPALQAVNAPLLQGTVVSVALEPLTSSAAGAEATPSITATGVYRVVLSVDPEQLRTIGVNMFRRGYSVSGKVITRRGRISTLLIRAVRDQIHAHRLTQ